MAKSWDNIKESWLSQAALSKAVSKWVAESFDEVAGVIKEIDIHNDSDKSNPKNILKLETSLRETKNNLKRVFLKREKNLDDISLNTPNSSKLQLSVPSNLNYLLKAWAAAEGRDLSSVALQCLENGLRSFKGMGAIPSAAIKRYDVACEKRIALAEINNAWEEYENSILEKE